MGFRREISKGAKFVPWAGEGGTHLSRPGPEDLEAQRQNGSFAAWWEKGGFAAPGLLTRIQSKRKVLAVLSGPQSVGFGQIGAEGELDWCFHTQDLDVSSLRSLRKGAGAFTLVLQPGVKERCVEPSPALIL